MTNNDDRIARLLARLEADKKATEVITFTPKVLPPRARTTRRRKIIR